MATVKKKPGKKASGATKPAPDYAKPAPGASELAPAKKYGPRRDLGAPVDGYLRGLPPDQRKLIEALRAVVRKTVPQVEEGLRWGMPVYSKDGLICYLRTRPDYATIGFYTVVGEGDPRLEGSGTGRHHNVRSIKEVDERRIAAWIREALAKNAKS
jgi:hypothetical protein